MPEYSRKDPNRKIVVAPVVTRPSWNKQNIRSSSGLTFVVDELLEELLHELLHERRIMTFSVGYAGIVLALVHQQVLVLCIGNTPLLE